MITIERAIEIKGEHCIKFIPSYSFTMQELEEAEALSIEALKRLQDMRISSCITADEILPCEAEEAEMTKEIGGKELKHYGFPPGSNQWLM